jgi:DNA sulfur modification protein DndE
MIVKQIRLSQQAKDQLIRLKGRTGIRNWNVLCRWALCLSLREQSVPADMEIPADSNVEMSWEVFAGEYRDIYAALIVQRCLIDGLGTESEVLARQFRLHLHRGISYLASTHLLRSCTDLVGLALGNTAGGN